MKKKLFICLLICLFGAFAVNGCTRRENIPESKPAEVEATQAPTPSPTPVPTPIPYDLVAQDSPTQYTYLQDRNEILSALDSLQENASRLAAEGETNLHSIDSVRLSDSTDQGDIMVIGGDYLYFLSNKYLVSVRLDGPRSRVLTNRMIGVDWEGWETAGIVSGSEKTPIGVYYANNRLAVLYDSYGYEGEAGELDYTEYISVDIFDVSDPSDPSLISSYGQDGMFRSASLVGNTLCLVTEYTVFQDNEGWNAEKAVPSTYVKESASPMEAGNICFAQDGYFTGYSVIGAYDLAASQCSDVKALLGVSGDVFADGGALYFHSARRVEALSRSFDGYTENAQVACTDIFRFTLEGEAFALSTATVNGTLANIGCLDAREGTVRLLTALDQRLYPVSGGDLEYAREEAVSGTAIYILDGDLNQAAKADFPANSEEIQWIGYFGDKAIVSLRDGETSIPVEFAGTAAPTVGTPLADYVTAIAAHPWRDDGYTAFALESSGKLTLTVYDSNFKLLSRRSFGSDHTSTLEHIERYLSDGEENLMGFTADDGYCLYGYSTEWGIFFREDVFLNDWTWNARGFYRDGYFYVADKREMFVLSIDNLQKNLAYLMF